VAQVTEKALLVIGPEPPPATGMEIATQALLAELRRAGVPYVRVDTADSVDELGNRGRWTLHNVSLAFRHVVSTARNSMRRDVGAVYIPIAQEFPGLVRDIVFLLIAAAARRPVIVHLHGGSFGDFYASRPAAVRALLRRTVGRAALGIVLTENLRPALECVLPAERVSVVANGIDAPSVGSRTPSDGTVNVLFLSSLFRWKGPLVFIDAFARAHEGCPSLRATVAGDWPSDEIRLEALRLADDLGVAGKLAFPGAVEGEDKRALFQSADIFCFASLVAEGQPLVILEAMAARLPVIAPAWPGIADTVVDDETGVLVDAPSPEALAEKLVELAGDTDRRLRLGTAGRRRYEQLFTQRAFGERMIQALRPFLDDSQSTTGKEKATDGE
jgi:glycosyltransferase involved in cell wall biosynthesis